jgi:hypothetical protein
MHSDWLRAKMSTINASIGRERNSSLFLKLVRVTPVSTEHNVELLELFFVLCNVTYCILA